MKKHESLFKDLRNLLYSSMPKVVKNVSVHDKPLTKMTFEQLRQLSSGYKDGWFCDGKHMEGCRGDKDYGNTDPEEYRYHCVQCSFDYCETCFKFYGNTHEHELQYLKHSAIMELHNGGYSSWGCDGK